MTESKTAAHFGRRPEGAVRVAFHGFAKPSRYASSTRVIHSDSGLSAYERLEDSRSYGPSPDPPPIADGTPSMLLSHDTPGHASILVKIEGLDHAAVAHSIGEAHATCKADLQLIAHEDGITHS